jgi:Prenyltransferase and squalene oxidase repeat
MSKKKRAIALAWLLLAATALCAPGRALADARPSGAIGGLGAAEAVTYIKAHQNSDGGFSEPDASSDTLTTCWSLIAGASSGEAPLSWAKEGATPQQYLDEAAGSTTALKEFEMMTIALEEAGGDPRSVAGRDLVSLIKAKIATDGKIGADVNEHCWGMLALATVGDTVPANCSQWLLGQKRQDGGWGESDQVVTVDTALAVQALGTGDNPPEDDISAALALLRGRINPDGGFKGAAAASDAQTTATVIEAVYAGGEDPSSKEWSFQGNNPVDFLDSLQAADGHFQFSAGVESQPVMTSAIALPATSGDYFPLAADSSASGTDIASQASGDLGTSGAGITSGGSAQSTVGTGNGQSVAVRILKGPASGAEGSATGASGLLLLLIACGIYSVLLLVLVLLVRRLAFSGRPGSGGRTAVRPAPRHSGA